MGPPFGSYLENGDPKILEDLNEEGVQREPHYKLEVELGQSNIAIRGSVRSLQIFGCDHFKAILPCYQCTILRGKRRLEVPIADRYFLSSSSLWRPKVGVVSRAGSIALLSIGHEATSGADSVEEVLGVETSLDKGSPNIGAKAVPEIVLTLMLPWLDICK